MYECYYIFRVNFKNKLFDCFFVNNTKMHINMNKYHYLEHQSFCNNS